MAIEFNCPYCSATIRVPGAYAGKQGRCPKCDTQLLIPSVPLPNQPTKTGRSMETQKPHQFPETPGGAPSLMNGSTPDVNDADRPDSDDPFAVRPVTTSVAKSRRRRARLRPSRALVIGIPVICFLVLFGIIAYSLMSSLPKLQGNLTGRRLDVRALPERTIAWDELSLNAEDREVLKKSLETNPESLISQFMTCQVSANEGGLVVTLAAQPDCQWIAVDVLGDKPLAIWKRKEGPQWNRMRLDERRIAANQYAKDKLLKVSGQQISIDAVAARDKVALNTSCGPLGYVVQAVAESSAFPCAAEDDSGKLYFCLPKTVQGFTIQGRTLANGLSAFSGEYAVAISDETVADEMASDATDPEETETADPNSADDKTMSEPPKSKGHSDGSDPQPDMPGSNPETEE